MAGAMKYFSLLLCFFIFFKLELSISVGRISKIEINSGVYFKELVYMRPYESSAPLVYVTNLPDANEILPILNQAMTYIESFKTLKNFSGSLTMKSNYDTVKSLYNAIIRDFKPTPLKMYRKRGISDAVNSVRDFFGDILVTCCRVLTYRDGRNFLENEQSLASQYSVLKDSVLHDHKVLFQIKDATNSVTKQFLKHTSDLDIILKNVSQNIHEIRNRQRTLEDLEKMNEIFHLTHIYFNSLILELTKLNTILQSCKNHIIPSIFITPEHLQNDIADLQQKLISLNLEVVMPPEDIDDYFHANLLNCIIHEHSLELEIKVPLKKLKHDYKAFSVVSLPFKSSNNKICSIDLESKLLIAEINRKIVIPLSSYDADYCNLQDHFCGIPQYRLKNKYELCLANLFENRPQHEIKNSCKFVCSENDFEAKIIQLQEEMYVVSNFETLLAIDGVNHKTQKIDANSTIPGAVLLHVPCHFEIVNLKTSGLSKTIISTSIPCYHNIKNELKITHTLPFSWIKSENLNISDFVDIPLRNMQLTNISWNQSFIEIDELEPLDVLEKKLKNIELKIPNLDSQETFSLIHLLMILWLISLTLIILLLGYIFVKIECSKAKQIVQTLDETFISRPPTLRERMKTSEMKPILKKTVSMPLIAATKDIVSAYAEPIYSEPKIEQTIQAEIHSPKYTKDGQLITYV